MTAIARGSFDTFLGIDLSQSSIDQTRSIVEFFNPELGDRFSLQCTDFLDAGDLEAGAYDALVMGEVLEHVEEPDRFLRRLADLAAPGAYIYVTTCINAPAIDHIHLWRNTDDLEALIERCGLTIRKALRLPYEGKTIKEAVEENLAINVAYVLEAE